MFNRNISLRIFVLEVVNCFRNKSKLLYKSTLCVEPVGPNRSFSKGPDSTLLLSTRAQSVGPNKANYKGPQVWLL